MRFRETNHLRKLANESGKKMRHRSRPDTRPQLLPDKPAAHEQTEPWWSDRVPEEQREMARKVYDLEVRQGLQRTSADSDTTREMRNSIAGR